MFHNFPEVGRWKQNASVLIPFKPCLVAIVSFTPSRPTIILTFRMKRLSHLWKPLSINFNECTVKSVWMDQVSGSGSIHAVPRISKCFIHTNQDVSNRVKTRRTNASVRTAQKSRDKLFYTRASLMYFCFFAMFVCLRSRRPLVGRWSENFRRIFNWLGTWWKLRYIEGLLYYIRKIIGARNVNIASHETQRRESEVAAESPGKFNCLLNFHGRI
jgi:hypothetical protein